MKRLFPYRKVGRKEYFKLCVSTLYSPYLVSVIGMSSWVVSRIAANRSSENRPSALCFPRCQAMMLCKKPACWSSSRQPVASRLHSVSKQLPPVLSAPAATLWRCHSTPSALQRWPPDGVDSCCTYRCSQPSQVCERIRHAPRRRLPSLKQQDLVIASKETEYYTLFKILLRDWD